MPWLSTSDIPGIGRKVVIRTHLRQRMTLISHFDGKRELYLHEPAGDARVVLLEEEARRVGSLLAGVQLKSEEIHAFEKHLGGFSAEWFRILPNCDFIGRRLGSLGIRKRTHASIVAVQRDDGLIPAPSSEFEFQAGDVCLVVGRPEGIEAFRELIRGEVPL